MSENNNIIHWEFIGDAGEFELKNPHKTSGLYFPLANEYGMMSAITPTSGGDIKTSQNTFLMEPVSVDDLHNSLSSRNFWLHFEDGATWSATGNSLVQKLSTDHADIVKLAAGFLWHKVSRENTKLGISAEITNFVPVKDDKVELMKVTIKNTGIYETSFVPTVAVPVYGRSADNIRDHRHVTSLLHRIQTNQHGVVVKPTLTFDERGHAKNEIYYSVQAADENGNLPVGFFPVMEDFIGEGGSLQWPEAVVRNLACSMKSGDSIDGYESMGAIRFETVALSAGESRSYIIVMGISDQSAQISEYIEKYGSLVKFDCALENNKAYWEGKLEGLSFRSADRNFDLWMKWVCLQPMLRRIYGCSFLPHHDYGKGGRGWRDLWQDCLALLLLEDGNVRELLVNNYAGVRLDGSNATIIGSAPGEFIADRNNIPRTWMDHGAWPYFTTRLYVDLTGDLDFLLEQQVYFKDRQVKRCTQIDKQWDKEYGSNQKDARGEIYYGTILEHILLQQVTSFYNVGAHNNMRLEGGDWNDGFDMAHENGESVAFTALFASNMLDLGKLLVEFRDKKGVQEITLAKEILILLDTINQKINYDSVEDKKTVLEKYMEACSHNISGEKVVICIDLLSNDLEQKATWIFEHIRKYEWIKNKDGFEWFNGYYDNDSKALEGDFNAGVRMTLTGQVFPIMGGIADHEQAVKIIKSVDQYLKDSVVGGIRLNTNFNEVKLNMGRCFGFAFGHKENGAMFSHMAIMYINALYKRGFVYEGYKVLDMIYRHCSDFEKSRIYPGIPEYINERGRGMYQYLTGSASWLLLTMRNEVYGVKGHLGDLVIEPKLVETQFDKNANTSIDTSFRGRKLNITYVNEHKLGYGQYQISSATLDGEQIAQGINADKMVIAAEIIDRLISNKEHKLVIKLCKK